MAKSRYHGLRSLGVLALASGFFVGYFPIAPGTAGTVVGVGLAWCLGAAPISIWVAVSLLVFATAVWSAHEAGKIYKIVDSPHIVIDEIIGFLVTMMGIPITWYWLLWGFILFRFFDVVKFPPADFFDEKVKNGFGVVMDDVMAGVYGNILLHLMVRASI